MLIIVVAISLLQWHGSESQSSFRSQPRHPLAHFTLLLRVSFQQMPRWSQGSQWSKSVVSVGWKRFLRICEVCSYDMLQLLYDLLLSYDMILYDMMIWHDVLWCLLYDMMIWQDFLRCLLYDMMIWCAVIWCDIILWDVAWWLLYMWWCDVIESNVCSCSLFACIFIFYVFCSGFCSVECIIL